MWIRIVAVLLLSLTVSACVTNVTGKALPTADKEKALASHIQLGLGYLRNKNLDLARHHFEKALAFDSQSAGALNGQALLYQLEGEVALAESFFLKALSSDPSSSRARNNYGNFLYQQKKYSQAYQEFETVTRDLQYNYRAGALFNLGRAAKKIDKVERAEAVFTQVLMLDPRMSLALIELAEIKFAKKEYAESRTLLDRYGKQSKQTARSLWLGIRIEQIFGNQDKLASHALALKNLYPYSKELLEYQNSLKK